MDGSVMQMHCLVNLAIASIEGSPGGQQHSIGPLYSQLDLEWLDCLREMLRTIPKHKGTDHLQADIKSRIKELSEEVEAP